MPPAGKAQDALRAQKDARQKKILIILAPMFLALLAWQGPGILKAFSGSKPPAPAAQQSTTPTPPAPDPTSAAAPSTTTGEIVPEASAPGELPEGDEPYEASEGQLVTFDRFVGKDPFRQQVSTKPEDGGGAPPPSDGGGGGGGTITPRPMTAAAEAATVERLRPQRR